MEAESFFELKVMVRKQELEDVTVDSCCVASATIPLWALAKISYRDCLVPSAPSYSSLS